MANLSAKELSKYSGRVDIFLKDLQSKDGIKLKTKKVNAEKEVQVKFDLKDKLNAQSLNTLKSCSKLPLAAIEQKLKDLKFNYSGVIFGLSDFYKTTAYSDVKGGNVGELAEAIFGAAVAARFMNKNKPIVVDDVKNILEQIGKVPGPKKVKVFESETANKNIKDSVELVIAIPSRSMPLIDDKEIWENHDGVVNIFKSCVTYANSPKPSEWAKLFYHNNQHDHIEVIADGISANTKTKVDVEVFVSHGGKGLKRTKTDINVSLKAGDVKQFGQIGGLEFEKQVQLWDILLGIDIETMRQIHAAHISSGKHDHAINAIFNFVKHEFDKRMKNKNQKIKMMETLGDGITHFATLSDSAVELIQLNKGKVKIFNFAGIKKLLEEIELKSSIKNSSNNTPTLILSGENNKALLEIRIKGETSSDNKGVYYRSYVEKGPLMDALDTFAKTLLEA